jgi:histidyl-tRNA synthetase
VSQLQPVRGTHDLLPDEMRRYRHVVDTARAAAECFGYLEVETPIFEFSEVFKRTLGDTSDIVTKEMYTFTDRGGETITLRPEGTASVARAFISGGLAQHVPLKYFYSGPMFRYERPQKGRLRQFHQTGVELLGVADPMGDVEIIALGVEVLRRIGIWDRCYLEVNSLGDAESRRAYRDVLVSYLSGYKSRLSKESQERLERNPMRILDSKDEGDREIVAMRRFIPTTSTRRASISSRACWRDWRRSGFRMRSIRAWCADSTITATPASRSSPTTSARRAP